MLLEIPCSLSDVAERTLPSPSPVVLLQSHADMAGNQRLGHEGDSGVQIRVFMLPDGCPEPRTDISELFVKYIWDCQLRHENAERY